MSSFVDFVSNLYKFAICLSQKRKKNNRETERNLPTGTESVVGLSQYYVLTDMKQISQP